MKDQKLEQLFKAARSEPAPLPTADFESGVMRAVRGESKPPSDSLLEHLAALFSRVACAAVLTMGLFIAGDFLLTAFHLPSLSDGIAQLSDQWLLTGNGI